MAIVLKFGVDDAKISALLQSYFQSGNINFLIGSGASRPALPMAGNIETAINDHLAAGHDTEADLTSLNFIEELLDRHERIGADAPVADVMATLDQYTDFLRIVDRVLFERKNVLLSRQANIFCTNYDLFIEHAAAKIPTLILNDGFKRAAAVGMEFPFAPECYFDRTYRSGSVYSQTSEMPTINLIKMHGSLSWKKLRDDVVYQLETPTKLPTADKADHARVRSKLEEFFLVLPNFRKFNATLTDRIYYGLLRLYANALERENALLICFGFSFADEHILDITRRSLRNPTAQVVVASYNQASVEGYQNRFVDNRNVAVLAPADGEVIDFAKVSGMIKSILPVDT